jgi:hypothetical protein
MITPTRKEDHMSDENQERPKRLTAQRKFQIYLETRAPDAPVGEIIRRNGLMLADLREVEETVEQAAIAALKINGTRKALPADVPPEEYARVANELQEKVKALADLTVEYQLFKKKQIWESEQERKRKSSRPN